jgi:hypothetical protein
MHYSLLDWNPFFPVGWHISQIFTKLFGKVASGSLSCLEEFCANLRNVSTNRKRGIALRCLENSLANSKALVSNR